MSKLTTVPVSLYMEDHLLSRDFNVHFRPGTSDENALTEVLERGSYRRLRSGFDVQPGERWLDLGANIGAFAAYCRARKADAECYEPDDSCFKILERNAPGFMLCRTAVTALRSKTLPFYTNKNEADHYRGTIVASDRYHKYLEVANKHGAFLRRLKFAGVKMDIEGAEAQLIDEWLLPRCDRLVFEYHSSKDKSLINFQRRMNVLRKHFKNVKYPTEFDKAYELSRQGKAPDAYMPFVDRIVFAWDWKG